MSLRQSVIKFAAATDKMEIIVNYDTREPENYQVTYAGQNGKDVTDFYRFCETIQECILYPQIIEGIAGDICARRVAKSKLQIPSSRLQIQKFDEK